MHRRQRCSTGEAGLVRSRVASSPSIASSAEPKFRSASEVSESRASANVRVLVARMRSCCGGTMAASIEPTLLAADSEPARPVSCRGREVLRGIGVRARLDQPLLRARARIEDEQDLAALEAT